MLGSNVSTVGGLPKAFVQARLWSCESIQVYTSPSRRWIVSPIDPALRESFAAERADSPVREVIAHVPFLVNCASPDVDARRRSVERLVHELTTADELGVTAVVLHPGFGGSLSRTASRAYAVQSMSEALARTEGCRALLLLENMAGQGSALCASFAELGEVLASIGRDDRVGVCFDTAHAFIAGYPLVGTDGYDEVLGILDREVGLHRVRAVHLNDAKTALGSRNDRHEAAGSGHMGSEVFARLVQDPRFFEIPVVLEVPDRDGASETALRWLRPLRDAARTAHNRMLREHHIVGPEPVIA